MKNETHNLNHPGHYYCFYRSKKDDKYYEQLCVLTIVLRHFSKNLVKSCSEILQIFLILVE